MGGRQITQGGGAAVWVVDGGASVWVVDGGASVWVVGGGAAVWVVGGGAAVWVVGGSRPSKDQQIWISTDRPLAQSQPVK